MFYDEKPYVPDPRLTEDLADRPVRHRGIDPHCDGDVLHAPGECLFCDHRPDRQIWRLRHAIAFTGHPAPTKGRPCPSDARRGTGGAHVWGGNRASG